LLLASIAPRTACPQEVEPTRRPSALTIDVADNAARAHLARVDALLKQDQWPEAVENLRQLIESGSDRLIPVDDAASSGFRRYVTLRDYAQMKLASLAHAAPAALAFYRELVDPIAEQYLKQADDERREEPLKQIVSKFLVSSCGDEALWRLGESALERGEWGAARGHWEQISPLLRFPPQHGAWKAFEGTPLWLLTRQLQGEDAWSAAEPRLTASAGEAMFLAYPDTNLPLADVRARLVLVSILEGNPERALTELELLRRTDPDARGRLGGQSGSYVKLLSDLLEQSGGWPRLRDEPGWPTFAGNAARNKHAQYHNDFWGAARWSAGLPELTAGREYFSSEGQRVAEPLRGLLSYHPIIVEDLAIVQAGPRPADIIARRLSDGEVVFGEAEEFDWAWEDSGRPVSVGVPRYTLTAQGHRLYARVGLAARNLSGRLLPEDNPSRIIGLDLDTQGRRVLELGLGSGEWATGWSFEGPPVSDGQRLYVVLRQRDAVHAKAHVAAYDARTGRRLWRRMVCGSETPVDRPVELTHTLLTLRQGTLYLNTNLGAVAALRVEDGGLVWLSEYPRADFRGEHPDRNTQHFFRDLNPCLLHEDLVIAAPSDSDRLFALDANTGRLLWSTFPEQASGVIHLLGVGGDTLLASGDCLYWFDVHTGQLRAQIPGPRKVTPGHARPDPRGNGRGLLTHHEVYWPTQDAIMVFEQTPRRSSRGWEPVLLRNIDLTTRGATGGNLVLADGALLIAAGDRLTSFD